MEGEKYKKNVWKLLSFSPLHFPPYLEKLGAD